MIIPNVLHRHRSFGGIFLGLDRLEIELASHRKKTPRELGAIGSIVPNRQSLIPLANDEICNVHSKHNRKGFQWQDQSGEPLPNTVCECCLSSQTYAKKKKQP